MILDNLRRFVQYLSLLLSNLYFGFFQSKTVYQGKLKSSCVPFLHCQSCPSSLFACPIGVIQHFMTQHKIPYTIMAYLTAIGATVGSMACGWACPFGLLQDLMYKIKCFKFKIPIQLSYFRYFVLLFLVLLIPFITQETWFSKLCPAGTLEAAIPWLAWNPVMPIYNDPVVQTSNLGWLFIIKIVILLFFLASFAMSKRTFCRVVCPLGAIFGLFNKISLVSLRVKSGGCESCTTQSCEKDCPVDLNVGKDPNASTCVRCFSCVKCDQVSIDFAGFSKKVKEPLAQVPFNFVPACPKQDSDTKPSSASKKTVSDSNSDSNSNSSSGSNSEDSVQP